MTKRAEALNSEKTSSESNVVHSLGSTLDCGVVDENLVMGGYVMRKLNQYSKGALKNLAK